MFERYISIDWSGAGKEDEPVNLAIVEERRDGPREQVVVPPAVGHSRSSSRAACRNWLVKALHPDQPRCLVAIDFSFGLPYGADRQVFRVTGWQAMVAEIARFYRRAETARAAAEAINGQAHFDGHGPYRTDDTRGDFRFYLRNRVAYYRLVELAVPQSISPWYLGSGAAVGFSTITGMGLLDDLLKRRSDGEVAFTVWPHEGDSPPDGTHVLAESYPALHPQPADPEPGELSTPHERDAWRVLHWMVEADRSGELEQQFRLTSLPFGRIEGASFEEQVHFEGWMLGVR